MARPSRELTTEERANISALSQYLTKEQIADYLGVSRPTFDAILERDEEAGLAYRRGKVIATQNVAKSLIQKAMNGNMTAAIFYLKTQAGWKEVQQVDVNTSVQSISELMDELSDDTGD